MDKEWEPVKVALTVLSGRNLQSKRKGEVCSASVVFGLGKELYQTEEVKSCEPEWNQEATINVSGKPNESLKFKLRDQGHTIGAVTIPLSSLTRLKQDTWYPLQPYKKEKEAHGELLLSCAVVEWRPLSQDSSSVGSVEELGDKRKGPFHHIRHRRTPSGGKVKSSQSLETESGFHVHWGGGGEQHAGGNLFPDRSSGTQTQESTGRRNSSADSETLSRGSSGDEDENPLMPEVTGISPSEGLLEGGERVTLRGSNLGHSRLDVIRVVLAGVDCTHTVEYFSSGKLMVTTPPHSSPVSGPVLVETVEGGEGVSSINFSYMRPSPRPSIDTSSPLLSKKKTGKVSSLPGHIDHERVELLTEVKALKQQIRELKDSNAELAEENSSLRCYMQKLLGAVIDYSPELLEIQPSE